MYWIPPGCILSAVAGAIYLLVYFLIVSAEGIEGIEYGLIAIAITATIGVVLPWLLPAVWIAIERKWWRILLGGSPIAPKLINDTLARLELSIRALDIDRRIPRQFAFLIALNNRLVRFQELQHELITEMNQKEKSLFKSTVDNLNEGWRSGLPPAILEIYMQFIEDTSPNIDYDDYREGLRGRCAVANVNYLLGNLKDARKRADKNWKEAGDDFVLKWMASYAYFSTTLFSGEFKEAMRCMAIHWREYYANAHPGKVEEALRQLSNTTLNPLLYIPRNLILAAAFEGSPQYDMEYWPSKSEFNEFSDKVDVDGSVHRRPDLLQGLDVQQELDVLQKQERNWLESWYDQAKRACDKAKQLGVDATISLDFSHACAGFYYFLLYLDSQDDTTREKLRVCADEAFKKIKATSPTASRYVKAGFYGIFKLVTEDDPGKRGGALEWLRRAAQYSAISGNKFNAVDCLFLCCQAVAAQRTGRGLKPEVDYYLNQVEKRASETDGSESRLYDRMALAAKSEIYSTPRMNDSAGGHDLSMKRILRIFHERHHEEKPAPASEVEEMPLGRAIKNLNDAWRSGMPLDVLKKYMDLINNDDDDDESDIVKDPEMDLRGQCAIANVTFLSGNWEGARKLARDNWKKAGDNSEWKWMASYTYFATTTFLRDFETGMGRMADHWNRYYASIPEDEQPHLIAQLHPWSLNPVLALPRNLILAAAFKGSPEFEERYWPVGQYRRLALNERRSELKWVESWYDQAKHACNKAKELGVDATISLDCSHAYAGFYFTVLYFDSEAAGTSALRSDYYGRAKQAFEAIVIDDESPTASRYVRSGFYGIFKLVTEEDPEQALGHFREAARLSFASGNRFGVVDFVFKCCHAVAAQRVEYKKSEGYLRPEVEKYLKEAESVAEEIGHYFYSGLFAAANSDVSRLRGDKARAEWFGAEAKNKMDQTGGRILRILMDEPILPPSQDGSALVTGVEALYSANSWKTK